MRGGGQILDGKAHPFILDDDGCRVGAQISPNINHICFARGAGGTAQHLDQRAPQGTPIRCHSKIFNGWGDAPMPLARAELGAGDGHGLTQDGRQREAFFLQAAGRHRAGRFLGRRIGQGQKVPRLPLEGAAGFFPRRLRAKNLGASQQGETHAVQISRQKPEAARPRLSQGALRGGLCSQARGSGQRRSSSQSAGGGEDGKDGVESVYHHALILTANG